MRACYRDLRFSSRNYEWQLGTVFGHSLLGVEAPEHPRKRALVSPYFRGNGLEKWTYVIHRNIADILDGAVARNAADLAERLRPGLEVDLLQCRSHYLPVYVIADMLGLPKSDYLRFWHWYTAMIWFLSNLGGARRIEYKGTTAARELREYLTPIIAARRAGPGDDLISALVTAEVDGEGLDDEEVKSHVTQLLNAGSETTDKTMGSLFGPLLIRRKLFEEVHEDRALVTAAISETPRHAAPR